MVSPGRMGVGWETISLIEEKGLKRYFQAVDQREREREMGREKWVSQSYFLFIIKLCNPDKLLMI